MTEVEIVIPAHNEADTIGDSLWRLTNYLNIYAPFTSTVTVVDNASTDGTSIFAQGHGASVVYIPEAGRGRAIRHGWMNSTAEVVAYMDVDLSADLTHLSDLVLPLLRDKADIAIGTRWHPEAKVERSPKRLAVSWCYNHLLQLSMGAEFSDAMCGFKAMQTSVAHKLLPRVTDNEWFFDAELLIRAQRMGLRFHEEPLTWTDDPDSSVDIPKTAAKALAGMWRLRRGRRLSLGAI